MSPLRLDTHQVFDSFVDNDMFMRYEWGMGIGHTYSWKGRASHPQAKSFDTKPSDSEPETEVNEGGEGRDGIRGGEEKEIPNSEDENAFGESDEDSNWEDELSNDGSEEADVWSDQEAMDDEDTTDDEDMTDDEILYMKMYEG